MSFDSSQKGAGFVMKPAWVCALVFLFSFKSFAQTPVPTFTSPQQNQSLRQTSLQAAAAQPTSTATVLQLEDLEQMALKSNPTLAQAEAAIRAAEGRRVRAGLPPNPVIGYAGEELAFRAIGEKSEHLGFIEQTIPLGGKLRKSRSAHSNWSKCAPNSPSFHAMRSKSQASFSISASRSPQCGTNSH